MSTLKKLYHNCSGFSLIEAIITIVIVGIVIVPISMVFMGSLQKATDAKEQLKSNQIAQLYIENLKLKSYDELIDFFTNNGANNATKRTLTGLNFNNKDYYFGFPELPEGYQVELSYDESSYNGYSVTQNPNNIKDFDFDVRIDLDYDSMKVYDGSNTLMSQFNADLDSNDLSFAVTIDSGSISINEATSPYVGSWDPANPQVGKRFYNNYIKINCMAEDNNYKNVTFSMKNDTNTTSTVFIVREDENKVDPILINIEGPLVINNNVSESSSSPYSIIEIEVAVKKNGKTTTVKASKTYE